MESSQDNNELLEDEEEYVLLDFDELTKHIDIPAGTPYVLTGLDSLNPVMVVGDNIKLIGEYQETIGTCIVFSESDREIPAVTHPETGTSEMDLFKEKCIVDSSKQVEPIASVQKVLKFRLATDDELRRHTDGTRMPEP